MFARPADLADCREMIRTGSRSFYLASQWLPDRVRQAAYALYAFCRLSDDAVDVGGGRDETIARLRARLDGIYGAEPMNHPVDRALADTVASFAMPRVVFDALLEGLEWDASERAYHTLEDVHAYGARVAGSVGAMMAVLMGARSQDLVARACDLGVAMQLTNIVRDVCDPQPHPVIAQASRDLLIEADRLYRLGDAGIANLAPAFRPAIFTARRLYASIGDEVVRNGLDNIRRRAVVPTSTKLARIAGAVLQAGRMQAVSPAGPPLAATAFLVEAVAGAAPVIEAVDKRVRTVSEDVSWLVDLFASLDRTSGMRRLES